MPLSHNAELANLIVRTIKGYAILVLSRDGEIIDWLGDAEAVTGYARDEAVGQNFDLLFTEPDRASGATRAEIDVALRDGRAEDSRWHLRKNGERFWANGLTMNADADAGLLVKVFRDETPIKRAEEQRILLLNELNHRVKNTLATVQSVVEQTLRAANIAPELRADLAGRIMALARAHNVLVDQSWAGADLDILVRDVAQPYERRPSPFVFDGPQVRLHPSQAVIIALALHELATNAVKYGALSASLGQVSIAWNLAHNGSGERYLTLLWKETGGPAVVEPTRAGFGTRLIRHSFSGPNGGRAELRFAPEGLDCIITLRLVDVETAGLETPSAAIEAQADATPVIGPSP